MSLKAFHLVFVAACIVLSMFVGAWGVRQYMMSERMGMLLLGVLFFVVGLGLLGYGFKFIRKVEEEHL